MRSGRRGRRRAKPVSLLEELRAEWGPVRPTPGVLDGAVRPLLSGSGRASGWVCCSATWAGLRTEGADMGSMRRTRSAHIRAGEGLSGQSGPLLGSGGCPGPDRSLAATRGGSMNMQAVSRMRGRAGRYAATALGAGVVLALGVLAPAAAQAAAPKTLYVSQGGLDSGTCTSANPCATVSYALTKAASGATIKVSGTIDDHLSITSPVTITTWPGGPAGSPAVLDGTASGTVVNVDGCRRNSQRPDHRERGSWHLQRRHPHAHR